LPGQPLLEQRWQLLLHAVRHIFRVRDRHARWPDQLLVRLQLLLGRAFALLPARC
jgi:hypothetical protein